MRGIGRGHARPLTPAIFCPRDVPGWFQEQRYQAGHGDAWKEPASTFRITAVSPRRTPEGNGSSRWESSRVRVGDFTWRKKMRPSLSGNSAATVGQAMRVRLSRRKWTRPTVGARITYAPQFEHPTVAEIRISKNRRETPLALALTCARPLVRLTVSLPASGFQQSRRIALRLYFLSGVGRHLQLLDLFFPVGTGGAYRDSSAIGKTSQEIFVSPFRCRVFRF